MADTDNPPPPTPATTPEPTEPTELHRPSAEDSSATNIDPEAARRRAIGDLLFFCKNNDLDAVKEIVTAHNFDVADTLKIVDYDMRTPLYALKQLHAVYQPRHRHLAATGGAWRVTNWLLHSGADVNALDGFGRTPLDDALQAGHGAWLLRHTACMCMVTLTYSRGC